MERLEGMDIAGSGRAGKTNGLLAKLQGTGNLAAILPPACVAGQAGTAWALEVEVELAVAEQATSAEIGFGQLSPAVDDRGKVSVKCPVAEFVRAFLSGIVDQANRFCLIRCDLDAHDKGM